MGRIEDSELLIQELVFTTWAHEWDDPLKAHIERIAPEMGCTWWEVVMENRDLFLDEVDDGTKGVRRCHLVHGVHVQ